MLLPTCGISETTRRSKTEQEVRNTCLDVRWSCIFHNLLTVAQRCQQDRRAMDTQRGQDQSTPNAFSTGEEASSPSKRKASRAGAPANGSTRTRAATNGWKSDFSSDFPFESLAPVAGLSFGLTASLERAIVVKALKFKGIAGRLHTDAVKTKRVPCSCQLVG